MKKVIKLTPMNRSQILARILMTSIALLIASPSNSETITIGINDYCPLTCLPQDSKPEGVFISLLEKTFPATKYKLSFVFAPYMRSFSLVQKGELTAITGILKQPNEKLVYPKTLAINSYACTYTRLDSTWRYNPNDLSSLRDATIGMIQYYGSTAMQRKFSQFNDNMIYLNPGKNSVEERLLRMIIGGRVDTGFLPSISANYLIQQHQWEDRIKPSGCGHTIYPETIGFSLANPNAQHYAEQLEKTYQAMRLDGSFSTLLESYGIQNTPE